MQNEILNQITSQVLALHRAIGLETIRTENLWLWLGIFGATLLIAWVGGKLSVWLARLIHMYFISGRMVYLQIRMPRNDSQKDREKATEKDFREKIGIMEQFYRAIWEINRLNIGNSFRSWLWDTDLVSFELVAKEKEAHFYVATYKYYAGLVEKQITSYYPDADITPAKDYTPALRKLRLRTYYLYEANKFWYPIRTYKTIENDPLNDLANVLSKLADDEIAAIQMIVNPINDTWRKKAKKIANEIFKGERKMQSNNFKVPGLGFAGNFMSAMLTGAEGATFDSTNAPGASSGDHYVRMLQTDEEITKQIGEKSNQPGFHVALQVIAGAKTQTRADEILDNLVLSFSLFRHEGMNFFRNAPLFLNKLWQGLLFYEYRHRLPGFFSRDSIMVPEELATIYHFPESHYNKIPIIAWLPYKVLPAPVDTPTEGILIGNNVYRGEARPVRMLDDDRTRHHYIIGKSGSGKSALISFMARQDIARGAGVGLIDPHGDLVEDVLKFIPKERAKDVILFDPGDSERPMGLNLLEANTPEERDMASLEAMEIFIKLFGDEIFGPRLQHYFRNGCLTLMEDPEEGATLIDVPRLFVDEAFQKYKVSKVKNPVVRSFWENEMAQTGQREKEEMIPYFSSKFGPFITNTTMRNIIGQSKNAFNFREVMDQQKILLINLSKGKIGDINAQLLGLIIVSKLQMVAMQRVDIPESERKPFYLYCDEFQNFATDSFATILSEARKYKLALVMAHQYINQLVTTKSGQGQDTRIRDAVFGNVGTMMSFKVGAEDAEYLAKEYAPELSEQDIIGIANYKAYLKLNIKNTTSRPMSIECIWDPDGKITNTPKNEKVGEIVKKYSRLKYGRKKEFVDAEVCARIGIET